LSFFICHDPHPRNSGYFFPIINLDKIVHANYSPSSANGYGEPLMEIKIATYDGYDCMSINGRDAYRLLQALGLPEPPPPNEYGDYPPRRKKQILPEPELEPDLDDIPL
jgi:hypothetical protein